jgi:hypothetical protein
MIGQIIVADFRERTRRYSFLVTLGFMFFFGFLVITGKYSINFGPCRGETNSAWVGAVMATATSWMMILVGFYIVKNSILRDRTTGVGQILAATQLKNRDYVFAKACSNALSMVFMATVLFVAAVVMQLLGNSTGHLSLWQILAPFLFITLPVIFFIAAVAVLFETIPFLNGIAGSILYFIIACQLITMPLIVGRRSVDPIGISIILPSMQTAAQAAYPSLAHGVTMGFVGLIENTVNSHPTFVWDGIPWTMTVVLPRLGYLAAAIVIVLLATGLFDRFDRQTRESRRRARKASGFHASPIAVASPRTEAGDLESVFPRFAFARVVKSELNLLLRRYSWKWHAVAATLIIVQTAVPYTVLRQYIMPIAWIWPVGVWSSIGCRERMFNTESLVFSSAHPFTRLLPAIWLAGLAITALCGIGGISRALLNGDTNYLSVLGAAVVFIPTMALFFGSLSGGNRLFEIVYVFLWYLGPINRMPTLDFLSTTSEPSEVTVAAVLLIASAGLLAAAWVSRWVRLATQ